MYKLTDNKGKQLARVEGPEVAARVAKVEFTRQDKYVWSAKTGHKVEFDPPAHRGDDGQPCPRGRDCRMHHAGPDSRTLVNLPVDVPADLLQKHLLDIRVPGVRGCSMAGLDAVYTWDDAAPVGIYAHLDVTPAVQAKLLPEISKAVAAARAEVEAQRVQDAADLATIRERAATDPAFAALVRRFGIG